MDVIHHARFLLVGIFFINLIIAGSFFLLLIVMYFWPDTSHCSLYTHLTPYTNVRELYTFESPF